eukprot:scaffold324351_cov58-Tisochrysis_lutea.AAC.3
MKVGWPTIISKRSTPSAHHSALRERVTVNHLGETEVDELEVAPRVEQQVLGFEVAVDNFLRVEVFEGLDNHRSVEQRVLLRDAAPVALEQREELAAKARLEQQVASSGRLEQLLEPHHERVVHHAEQLRFGARVELLSVVSQHSLGHRLERERAHTRAVCVLAVGNEPDGAKRASAEEGEWLQLVETGREHALCISLRPGEPLGRPGGRTRAKHDERDESKVLRSGGEEQRERGGEEAE